MIDFMQQKTGQAKRLTGGYFKYFAGNAAPFSRSGCCLRCHVP